MTRVVRVAALLAAATVGVTAVPGVVPASAQGDGERVVFTIDAPQITESSALAISTEDPGLVYTVNDSGDLPNVYVLDARNGRLVGTTTLGGVEATDVEGLAIGTDGTLVVADIGDNQQDSTSVTIHRIPQPGRGDETVEPTSVSLTYSNGARDAEAVLYDADDGRVYVVSKQLGGAHVYRSPKDVFDQSSARLTPVAQAPGLATDATFIPGQPVAVIRTYFGAVAYDYPSWRKILSFDLPSQDQGESIAAPAGGDEVWVGSEGERSTVIAVPLPDLTPDEPTQAPSSSAPIIESAPAAGEQSDGWEQVAWVVVVGASVALVLLILAGTFLYRRHHPDE